MKRALVLILLFALLLSAGCSAAVSPGKSPATTTAATTKGNYGEKDSQGAGTAADPERKIVRNASIDLEVKDVLAAYNELLAFAAARGGYEMRRVQGNSGGYVTIDAQIKIRPSELDAFLAFAATVGTLINTETASEDITENYYDAQTRLASMEKSLLVYYGFLDNAASIDETLRVQNEINRLTLEIESLKGKLKLWDSLLAESLITLRMRQTEDPVKIKKEINWSTLSWDDMAYLMRSGLTRLVNFLVNVLQWLLIAAVVTTPLWLIALIVLLLVLRKKKAACKAAAASGRSDAAAYAASAGEPPQDETGGPGKA